MYITYFKHGHILHKVSIMHYKYFKLYVINVIYIMIYVVYNMLYHYIISSITMIATCWVCPRAGILSHSPSPEYVNSSPEQYGFRRMRCFEEEAGREGQRRCGLWGLARGNWNLSSVTEPRARHLLKPQLPFMIFLTDKLTQCWLEFTRPAYTWHRTGIETDVNMSQGHV